VNNNQITKAYEDAKKCNGRANAKIAAPFEVIHFDKFLNPI